MPSPLGHALAGAAIGWALSPGRRTPLAPWPIWTTGAACGLLAVLPDLDLLWPGAHRGPTHSVGAAGLVGVVALAATRHLRRHADDE